MVGYLVGGLAVLARVAPPPGDRGITESVESWTLVHNMEIKNATLFFGAIFTMCHGLRLALLIPKQLLFSNGPY